MKRRKETKIRVTEKALYASLFAVVLSCAMLFESTYAWFTQTVATPVSVIQTGSMNAKLVIADAAEFVDAGEQADANGEATENNLIFRNIDTGSTVFQPGRTYQLPAIYVQNTGDIDLSFTVTLAHDHAKGEAVYVDTENAAIITMEDGTTKALSLYDVLEFSAYVVENNGAEAASETAEAVQTENLQGPIPLTVAREGQENTAEIAAVTQDNTVNIISGILEASQNKENIPTSKAMVIQVKMDEGAGIEYAGLELSGLQIIVNATQIIPEQENTATE
ncbi:MAG: hypothetical protein IKK03_16405 [Lachnospiraceae bacterium]|nr:hypothetical protein [Lachnospiraceae bacterium]